MTHRMVQLALVLQGLAISALGLSHLALTDIWHGEGNLALEWRVLPLAAAVILTALVFSTMTLARVLRCARGET